MNLLFLKDLQIHPDWEDFLSKDIKRLLIEIEKETKKSDYTPTTEKVLRFLTAPLGSVKIIILGQDPYPQKGVATGRSFEVGTLRSWNEPFSNISLKNILRTIYKAYTGQIIKYSELKTKFDNEFPVLPPNKLFANWEQQGVLLLNTYFTCEIGQPGSHKSVWEDFSSQLFKFVNGHYPNIIWFLWGAHAIESTANIDTINSVISMHPMMCFSKPGRDTDFLYGETNCFKDTVHLVKWTGYEQNEYHRPSQTLF